MFRHILVLLLVIQYIAAGDHFYTDQTCYVSGALPYEESNINGKYIPSKKWCNSMFVWRSEKYGFELSYQNISEYRSRQRVLAWVLKEDYYDCNGGKVYAKNYWKDASSPAEVYGYWYQYDVVEEVFFSNRQLNVTCTSTAVLPVVSSKDELNAGEIAGIVVGSILGAIALGGILFCICMKCKASKQYKALSSTANIASMTNIYDQPNALETGIIYPAYDNVTDNKLADKLSPPAYVQEPPAYVQDF